MGEIIPRHYCCSGQFCTIMSNSENNEVSAPNQEKMEVANGDGDAKTENGVKEEKAVNVKPDAKGDEEEKKDKKSAENEESEDDDDKPSKNYKGWHYVEESDEEGTPIKGNWGVIDEGKKRERKKVDRIEVAAAPKEEKAFEPAKGQGEKLGDMPRVEYFLNRTRADELKPLYRLLFKQTGKLATIKKHIRLFNGFDFEKDSTEWDARLSILYRFVLSAIKQMCDLLDVEKKGTKEEICDRLMEFCLKPVASGKKVPEPKRKKSKGESKKRKRSSSGKKGKKTKSKETASDDDDDEEQEEDAEKSEEEEDNKASDEEAESEEEVAPKKKKAKVEKKEEPAPKKKKAKKVESDSSDNDSDDEPLVAAPKKESPPTNTQIKKVIQKIMKGADLETVTMKTVCKQVYDTFPKFDITDRKDFIKSTVKDLIQ